MIHFHLVREQKTFSELAVKAFQPFILLLEFMHCFAYQNEKESFSSAVFVVEQILWKYKCVSTPMGKLKFLPKD
jgi:hypothetical protein